MKKIFVLTLLSCFFFYSKAQQNVGIGTTTPGHALEIRTNSIHNGKAQLLLYENTTGYARLKFQNSGNSNYWDIATNTNTTTTDARMNFYYGATGNILTLTGDGKVGIGNFTPSATLDVAGNTRANSFQFTVARPFYYSVSGADFSPINSAQSVIMEEKLFTTTAQNGVFTDDLGLLAPVHLPHGATILNFTVYFTDNATQNLNVKLIEYNQSLDLNTTMGEITTTGTPNKASITSGSIMNPVIDNQNKNYKFLATESSLNPWPAAGLLIRGITITYTVTEAQ